MIEGAQPGVGQVSDQEERGIHNHKPNFIGIGDWVDQRVERIIGDAQGVRKHIPTVPTQEAPQVDSVTAQTNYHQSKGPAYPDSQVGLHDPLDRVQRHDRQEDTCPGSDGQKTRIIPDGDGLALGQVNEIGHDVKSIRQK